MAVNAETCYLKTMSRPAFSLTVNLHYHIKLIVLASTLYGVLYHDKTNFTSQISDTSIYVYINMAVHAIRSGSLSCFASADLE